MNPKQLEQFLLLEMSGELSPRQRRELDAQLAASAEARRQRDDLRRLAAALPAPAAQPAPGAAAQIAARLRQPARPAFNLLPAWKPALAAAAALAVRAREEGGAGRAAGGCGIRPAAGPVLTGGIA